MYNKLYTKDKLKLILESIVEEFSSATAKFGSFNGPHEGYAVILEELDELWDDVKKNNIMHAVMEAKQVAAMAIRFIYDLEDFAYVNKNKMPKM